MELLVAAVAVLSILVLGLGVVVFALARQVGVLYERVAPAGALMINQQLNVGDAAPVIAVQDLRGKRLDVGRVDVGSQLLFFLAPDCPICKSLIPVLKSVGRAEKGVEIILLSDGETPLEHERYVESQDLQQFSYVLSEPVGRAYGVSKLPYAVLINQSGEITSLGIVNSREHLESLFEAQRLGVASIQDYLAQPVDDPIGSTGETVALYHDAAKK